MISKSQSYANKGLYSGTTCNETIPNATGTNAHHLKVNKYDFSAPLAPKSGNAKKLADAERAITSTIQYLGWMSLKDSDHCEYAKAVGQGDARRAAADRLIAAGTIVQIGTWSNGIAVGPGVGFTAATQTHAAAPAVTVSKPARKTRKPIYQMVDTEYERAAMREDARRAEVRTHAEEATKNLNIHPDVPLRYSSKPDTDQHGQPYSVIEGQTCDILWYGPAAAMHGPAYVAPLAMPPGIAMPETYTAAQAIGFWQQETRISGSAHAVALTNNHYAASVAPTPIYEPAVGQSVFIVLKHENGTTTDRVVDVQRVKLVDGAVTVFRGYDRRRDRCRNYLVADCAVMRVWDGLEVFDANGRTVVAAA